MRISLLAPRSISATAHTPAARAPSAAAQQRHGPACSGRPAAYAGGTALVPGLRARELAFDGAEHEVVDLAAVAEAHFELLRMRVHVDQRRVDVEIQHVGRLPAAEYSTSR